MIKLLFIGIVATLLLTSCEVLQSSVQIPEQINTTTEIDTQPTSNETNSTNITITPPPIIIQPRNGSLNLYFLNIQGDATIVQKDSESILINGGRESDSSTILKTIRDLGIGDLGYVLLTNPSYDTIGSIPYIALRAKPKKIYESGLSDGSTNYKLIKEVFGNTTIVPHNTIIDFDNALTKILVAYDDGQGLSPRVADNSLVVKMVYGNTKILLMGSCGFECEERLSDEDLDADILRISDDCSASSLTFLKKVNPEIAIVKDICSEVEQRFINLAVPLYKIKDGNIVVYVKEDSYEVIR